MGNFVLRRKNTLDFNQYLGKTVRVELDTISITIMDTMDIDILESEIKKIDLFTW